MDKLIIFFQSTLISYQHALLVYCAASPFPSLSSAVEWTTKGLIPRQIAVLALLEFKMHLITFIYIYICLEFGFLFV